MSCLLNREGMRVMTKKNENKKPKFMFNLCLILIVFILSLMIVSFFIPFGNYITLLSNDIFGMSFIMTFLLTSITLLLAVITFMFSFFENLLKAIATKDNKSELLDRSRKVVQELKDNFYFLILLLVLIFAGFLFKSSTLNYLAIFSLKGELVFKLFVYIGSFLAIIDTVVSILNLFLFNLYNGHRE